MGPIPFELSLPLHRANFINLSLHEFLVSDQSCAGFVPFDSKMREGYKGEATAGWRRNEMIGARTDYGSLLKLAVTVGNLPKIMKCI